MFFTALTVVAEVLKGSHVKLGGQDLYWETQGAFTGEVSAAMILDAGAKYAIIGHSERRQFFGETDETVNRKILMALAAELQKAGFAPESVSTNAEVTLENHPQTGWTVTRIHLNTTAKVPNTNNVRASALKRVCRWPFLLTMVKSMEFSVLVMKISKL